jgi:hypothetical protein
VGAGPNQTVTFPTTVSLSGTVTDDGLPNPPGSTTKQWTKFSGPGAATFTTPNQTTTDVTFNQPGTYVLRLTADDSAQSASADVTITETGTVTPSILDRAVATSSDDAEEWTDGSVHPASSDLELTLDTNTTGNQVVGMRFANITVPVGATITNAYVQFETDEVSTTNPVSLTVQGQKAPNPGTFTTAALNISSRARTTSAVPWSPPTWPTIQVAGPDQRTPNLKDVISEIIGQSGWASGNAMAIIITGTGKRTAESFNGTRAPVLHIEYTTGGGPPTNQAPTVNAGPDQTVTFPTTVSLNGTVNDDGLPSSPGTTTKTWTKVSGPGTPTFSAPNQASTNVTFDQAGTYVLRLTANDGDLSGSDDVSVTESSGGATTTLERPIAAASDDAEQQASGPVDLSSSDIELVQDGSSNKQTDGLRFTGITVPQGATITKAYVQFQVDEATTAATSLTIKGENANTAATFTTATNSISSRPQTIASVPWTPAGWPTVGARGVDQRTPEIKAIVQEIVSRTGWASGNALAIIVTGTGKRTAEAFESGAAIAAVIHIEYTT